jgi:hypothetical protein
MIERFDGIRITDATISKTNERENKKNFKEKQ